MKLIIDKRRVSLEDISGATNVEISKDKEFETFINHTHDFMMNTIKQGKPIYGITTGYGDSGKNYVNYEDAATLQVRTTNDDPGGSPTWSTWKTFIVGEYTARAYQFQIILI